MIHDLLANLQLGFSTALSLQNLMFCLIGALVGTLVGVLPGVGPLTAVAMLLPVTFTLDPVSALIMLAGIYYGAQYGGSTTAILINLPGESSGVVTCLDGYQMARQGRAGPALAIAAIGSLIAGTFATFVIAVAAVPLARVAQKFGATEYFSLMLLGLIGAVVLASGSLLKAISMILIGLLLGLVGTDVNSGVSRMAFDWPQLSAGIGFVPIAMGLFGLPEIILSIEGGLRNDRQLITQKVSGLFPTMQDFRQAFPAIIRGTGIGTVLGILPGGGALLSSFAAYAFEKKIARDPSRFGRGAIEGVAAPESANNAGAQTSFIPLLTLGIPSNPIMAMMAAALMIQGIAPGPQMMTQQPKLFWGVVASMWIGNAVLLVINLPLIGIWIRLLRVPYRLLFPAILLFCSIGVYSVNNSVFDVVLLVLFGGLGYMFLKLGCEPAPLLLGFVLGPMMEENFRRALLLSRGDPLVFFARPISATMLLLAFVLLLLVTIPTIRRKRRIAFEEI